MDEQLQQVLTSLDELAGVLFSGGFALFANVLLYSGLGFLIAIVLFIFLSSRSFATRPGDVWNILAKFHYLFLFIGLMVGSSLLGATRSLHHSSQQVVSIYLRPTLEVQVPRVQQAIVEMWPQQASDALVSAAQTSDRLIQNLHYVANKDEWFGEQKQAFLNWMIDDMGSWLVSYLVTTMINQTIKGTADTVGVDAQPLTYSVQKIRDYDFSKTSSEIAVTVERTAKRYIDGFFYGVYLNIAMLFVFIIAVPIIESLFYFAWYRPRQRKLQAACVPAS